MGTYHDRTRPSGLTDRIWNGARTSEDDSLLGLNGKDEHLNSCVDRWQKHTQRSSDRHFLAREHQQRPCYAQFILIRGLLRLLPLFKFHKLVLAAVSPSANSNSFSSAKAQRRAKETQRKAKNMERARRYRREVKRIKLEAEAASKAVFS